MPRLEHEDIPDVIAPASFSGQKLLPLFTNWSRMEKPFLTQPRFSEQIFRPIPQRTTQPGCHRDAKAHFRSVYQFARHILIKYVAQDPLSRAGTYPHVERQSPG